MMSAATLLQIWEYGLRARPVDRSVQLLSFALPDVDQETIACIDLGSRDWHLLRLRLAMFGPTIAACTECPECGERLEFEFNATELGECCPSDAPVLTSIDGRRFRLPNVGDLVAIAGIDNGDVAARQLFERCSLDGPVHDTDPTAAFEEVDERLEALAADRGVSVELSCAACGRQSRHALDPGEFLWGEIVNQATSLLDDIHRLACAYKWPERDILAMSAARRAAYLSRVE
jgi:hypothetical protein